MKPTSIAAALALLPALARAHQAGLSYGEVTIRGERVEVALRASAAELAFGFPALGDAVSGGARDFGVGPRERALSPDSVREIMGTISLNRGGTECPLERGEGRTEAPDGLRLTFAYRCAGGGPIEVRAGFVGRMPRGHTHLAKVLVGGRIEEHVARAGSELMVIDAPPAKGSQLRRFIALGIEHIFTGYDHVAFLLGLLLLGGGLGQVVRAITSFTVAHSVTLALAALGVLAPPPRFVEPLIAASIVWVAIENLRALRPGAARRAPRWFIGFAFGLVHGFGFAGALRELALPRPELTMALVGFNAGVELGQATIVAVAFPLLARMRRWPRFVPGGLRAGSIALGLAGLGWFIQRVAILS